MLRIKEQETRLTFQEHYDDDDDDDDVKLQSEEHSFNIEGTDLKSKFNV